MKFSVVQEATHFSIPISWQNGCSYVSTKFFQEPPVIFF